MNAYVLVVDDDADLRTMMGIELSKAYPVVEAESVEVALAALQRYGTPLAVVSDLHLGIGRGDVLLSLVQQRHPGVARILVSGSTGTGPTTGAPHALLRKPWTRGRLLATVAESVARASREHRAERAG